MGDALRNRPILILAIGLILGITLREYSWNLLLISIPAYLVGWRRSAILLFGIGIGVFLAPQIPKSGIEKTQYLEMEASVSSVPRLYPEQIVYELDVGDYRLTAREPRSSSRVYGDRLFVRGLAKPLRDGTDDYLLAKGIVGRFQPIEVRVAESGPIWFQWASQIRAAFVDFSHSVMPKERAAVLDALCFNVEGGLSDEFEKDLRRTGTIHIISASGLHVFILAATLDLLLGLTPLPRKLRLAILFVLLAAYASAAGLQPAIIRSVLMYVVASTAFMWMRESDLLSALALAAIVYLAWDPYGVYNLGFQFSFLTVGAFALLGGTDDRPVESAMQFAQKLATDALKTTNIAYWATLPLLLYYFGTVSFVAIPSNLLIVPIAMLLVVAGMGAWCISAWIPSAAQAISSGLLQPLIQYLESVLSIFGNLIIASIPGGYFSAYFLVPVYLAFGMVVKERVRPA